MYWQGPIKGTSFQTRTLIIDVRSMSVNGLVNFCLDLSKILVNGILLKLPTYFVVVKQGKYQV